MEESASSRHGLEPNAPHILRADIFKISNKLRESHVCISHGFTRKLLPQRTYNLFIRNCLQLL